MEVGILGAQWLLPMKMKDGRGTTDAYCVAKYGQKWVRTRTILDNLSPKWNEQYTWELYDPCRVITLGVFNNCHLGSDKPGIGGAQDARIGKDAFAEINRHVHEPNGTIDSLALLCKSLEGELHRADRQGLGGIDDLNDYDQEMPLSFAIDNFL
ncbi:protein QUIRKY-like [Forsythia ovata]|uniref:Protein QUIRKY-like n=1 Tax=Forsythia ovata TaxID=205694 RepID=A0ABD1W209_9LAMI